METMNDLMNESDSGGCAGELVWLGKGFYQPLFILDFYRQALGRRLPLAVLFFVVFGGFLAILSVANVLREMRAVNGFIQGVFERGEFPEIVIENGIARVDGRQPFVVLDNERQIFILDTTGEYRTIDRSRYAQGFLLTREELHVLDEGDYQILALTDFHEMLGVNPIVVDQDGVLSLWRDLSRIIGFLVLIGLGLWNVVIWFMFMCFLAVVMWGVASLMQRRSEYGEILIVGIYAFVPASYLQLLLWLVPIRFIGFKTLLLLLIWGFLVYRLMEGRGAREPIMEQS